MILFLHYQNLSANNAVFVIIVEILHVLIKIIPSKMRANYQNFLGRIYGQAQLLFDIS
jgi:hypothetical protein